MDRTFSPRPMVFLLSTLGLLQVTYYIDRELEASPCKPGLKLPKPTVSSQIERPKAGGSISTKTTNAMEPKGKPTAMTLGFTKTVPAAERPNFKEAVSEVTQSTHRKAASFNASSLQGLQQLNASADFKQTVEAFTARISKLSQKSTQLNQEFKVSGDAFEREVDCLVRDTMRGRKELSQVKQSIEDELEDAAALLGSTQDVMRQVYEAKVISEESSLSKSYFQEHKILSTLPPVMVEKKIKLHGSLLEAKDKLSRAQEILLRAECMDSISQERLYGDLKDTSVRTRAMAEKIADLEKEIESLYLNTGRSIYQMKRSTAVTNSLRNHQRDLSQRRWGVLLNAIRSKCASEVSKSSSTPRNSTMTARLNGRWSHVKSFITPSSAIVASPAVFTLEQVPPPQPVEEQVSKPSIIRTPQETNAPVPPVPVAAPSSFSFGAKAVEKPKETKAPVPPVPAAAPSAFSFGAKADEKPKETKAPVPPVPAAAPSSFSFGAKADEKPKETKAPVPPVPVAAPSSFSFGAKADEKPKETKAPVPPVTAAAPSSLSFGAKADEKPKETKAPVPPVPVSAPSAFSFGAKAVEKPKETNAPVPPVPAAAPSSCSFGAKAVEKPKETKAPVPPVPVAAPSAFSCGAKAEEKPKETKAPVPPVPAAAPSSFSFGAKADEKTTAVITTVSPLGVESSSGVSKEALSETKAFDTATSAFSFSGLSRSINEASESQKSASLGSAFSTAPNSGESKASSTAKVAWGTAAPKSLFQTSPSSTVSASSLSTAGGQPPFGITPASSIFKPASATPISTETTPKPGFFASSPSAAMSFEDKIKGFYAKYNPSKIDEVPGLVAKYHGREQELFEKLEKKYNVKYFSDTPTFGSAPSQVFGAGFGGAGVTSTVFGQNAQLKSPAVEGKSSPFAAPFGGTTPFGQSSGQSLFGTASSTSPAFGKQQTATEISSPSTFGQPAVFGSKFGQPSNVFNAAPNVSSSTPFAKSSPAFGQVSFGQAQLSTLGQGFGATSSSIPFVQTAQAAQGGGSTLFGKPTQPIFGQPSMLGKASNPFGGPSDDSEMAMSDDQPAQGPPAGSSLFGGQFQSQAFKTFR